MVVKLRADGPGLQYTLALPSQQLFQPRAELEWGDGLQLSFAVTGRDEVIQWLRRLPHFPDMGQDGAYLDCS
jgi:hypothetical protein